MNDKRPRQLAVEILHMRDRAQRRKMLAAIECPRTRATVRFYVESYVARRFKKPLPDYEQIKREETAAQPSGILTPPAEDHQAGASVQAGSTPDLFSNNGCEGERG